MEIAGLKSPLKITLPLILCLCYIFITLRLFSMYLVWDLTLIIGLAIVPYVYSIEKGVISIRFLIPALLFTLLAIVIPAKSTLFFSLVFTMLMLLESYMGKVNLLFSFILILISPFFKFLSDTLSFPLRLWLSSIVAETMTFFGMDALSTGNIIIMKGYEFYIDQACAGLNMLNVSLMICIFILAFHQKKTGTKLPFLAITGLLLSTLSFNIIANFFRILTIVIFKIIPGTAMHDMAGMLSLIVYVILPLIAICGPFTKWLGRSGDNTKETKNVPLKKPALHLILFGCIIFIFMSFDKKRDIKHDNKNSSLNGYKKTPLENNVLKFENKEALIYMKPTPFYAPEHNPMICWKGSGYEFQFIKKEVIMGKEIYSGTLVKGKDKIYASWWFDDGHTKTIDQLQWRWQAAQQGKQFYLVNVNTTKLSDLKRITETLLPSPFAGNL